jgi:hypothetical protein
MLRGPSYQFEKAQEELSVSPLRWALALSPLLPTLPWNQRNLQQSDLLVHGLNFRTLNLPGLAARVHVLAAVERRLDLSTTTKGASCVLLPV